MTRRRVFDEVGGFDERFPIDFNDVDYCLRLGRAGYRVVFTPWAQLYHHESASFGARPQDLDRNSPRCGGGGRTSSTAIRTTIRNLTRDFPDYRLRPPIDGSKTHDSLS